MNFRIHKYDKKEKPEILLQTIKIRKDLRDLKKGDKVILIKSPSEENAIDGCYNPNLQKDMIGTVMDNVAIEAPRLFVYCDWTSIETPYAPSYWAIWLDWIERYKGK